MDVVVCTDKLRVIKRNWIADLLSTFFRLHSSCNVRISFTKLLTTLNKRVLTDFCVDVARVDHQNFNTLVFNLWSQSLAEPCDRKLWSRVAGADSYTNKACNRRHIYYNTLAFDEQWHKSLDQSHMWHEICIHQCLDSFKINAREYFSLTDSTVVNQNV